MPNRVAQGFLRLFGEKLGIPTRFSYKTIERGFDLEKSKDPANSHTYGKHDFQYSLLSSCPYLAIKELRMRLNNGSQLTSKKYENLHTHTPEEGAFINSSLGHPKWDYVYNESSAVLKSSRTACSGQSKTKFI
jgi:hypothetical protein